MNLCLDYEMKLDYKHRQPRLLRGVSRRRHAPREREGLFDIVSWLKRDARPHSEERACASAFAKSNARARVSKDEDGRGMDRSALGPWKPLRSSCRDAHSAGRAAHFGKAKRSRAGVKHQPAAVGSDRWFDLPVSGLLFTGNAATATCRAAAACSTAHHWCRMTPRAM